MLNPTDDLIIDKLTARLGSNPNPVKETLAMKDLAEGTGLSLERIRRVWMNKEACQKEGVPSPASN